jgi:hypothetical protein
MNGFTDDQIIELRKGEASWDSKTNVLAQTAQRIAATSGMSRFFERFSCCGLH